MFDLLADGKEAVHQKLGPFAEGRSVGLERASTGLGALKESAAKKVRQQRPCELRGP